MSMSLTKKDLQAIKQLIDDSIDERVPRIIDERVPAIIEGRVQPMLDKLEDRMFKRMELLETRLTDKIDRLSKDTADGFAEVHEKINGALSVIN